LAVVGAATALTLPNFNYFVEMSPREMASAPMQDPVVSAMLKDIQLSQQQNAVVLDSLKQSSAAQLVDLKRICDQLSSLAIRVDALQNAATPLVISAGPQPNPRAQISTPSRKKRSRPPETIGSILRWGRATE